MTELSASSGPNLPLPQEKVKNGHASESGRRFAKVFHGVERGTSRSCSRQAA